MLTVNLHNSPSLAAASPLTAIDFLKPIISFADTELLAAAPSKSEAQACPLTPCERKAADALDFTTLVDAHYENLYRFAMSLTRAESDACDLVQDTFLSWATKGHQLLNPKKVKSWLFTTLHRRFLMTRQRRTRFPHLEISSVEEELPKIEADSVYGVDIQQLSRSLAEMDAPYRAAVALFYLEDYSYQEIATILEVPIGTVKSRIARGLAKLRELVAEHDNPRLAGV